MAHDPYQLLARPFSLEGYCVIITGAGGAIGGATAQCLATQGANIVVSDLNLEAAEKVAAAVHKCSDRAAIAVRTDVTKEVELATLVDATLKKFGKITALINNVGWGEYTPLWEVSTDYMVKSYVLNTVSAFNLSKLCMPHLKQQENASITMSGSAVGTSPSPEFIAYSNAKAALLHMARSIAMQSGPEVRCNALVIGSVDNGEAALEAGYDENMLERLADSFVLKRRGTPFDIAYAFNYLLSPAAAWVTAFIFISMAVVAIRARCRRSDPA